MTKHNFKLVLLSIKEEVQNLELKTEDIKLISNIISVFNNSKIDIGDNLKETLIAIPPDNLVLTVYAILALLALISICLTVGFIYYHHTHNKSSPQMKEKGKYDANKKKRCSKSKEASLIKKLSTHLSHPNHLSTAIFRWFFILSIS